jgi:hypothetical protein
LSTPDLKCIALEVDLRLHLMAAPTRSDAPRRASFMPPKAILGEVLPVCGKCFKPMALDAPALCTGRSLREKQPTLNLAEANAQHLEDRAKEEARYLAYKREYKAERLTRLRASYTRRREAAAAAFVGPYPIA